MGYTALYRKFRPMTFSEMVGQEAITRTLKNQIIANRVGHAYLFNGSRGTGKTSSAKILARAINCLSPKDGEPCNECEICKSALNGSLTDIVEMDAASNNSVEDIRSIREEVNFLPTKAKYRVYIIDEVHMLSQGAFNALLKTLEEPPEHVKFILATTEPQKLPATILSRCQRFDFKRISNEDIIKRLEIVCKESNIQITKKALEMIAVLSEGAMRDALSILERCIQDESSNVDEEKVRDLVGIPKFTSINEITKSIITYDVQKALEGMDEVLKEGKDIDYILWEIIKYIKDILIYKTTSNIDLYTDEEIEQIKELTKEVTKERLINLIYSLSELEAEIKWSRQKTIVFQAGIIKLCNKQSGISEDMEKRIQNVEKIVEKSDLKENKEVQNQTTRVVNKVEIKPEVAATKQVSQNKVPTKKYPNKAEKYWPEIMNDLKQSGKIVLYTNLLNTKAKELNDMTVGIEFPGRITAFGKTVLEKPENIREISNLVSIACGKEMQIKYIAESQISDTIEKGGNIEELAESSDIPFNIIE